MKLVRLKCGMKTLLRVLSLALSTAVSAYFSSALSIPIAHFFFHKTNYLIWKTILMSFIEAQVSFVDGTEKEPKDFLEIDDKKVL